MGTARRRARWLVATSLALAGLGGAPASARPGHEPTPARPAAQVSLLRLLDRTPWVGDGLDFELSVQLVATPPGSRLQVTVHDRVRSRSEFDRTLDGQGLRSRLSGPSPVAVDQLDPDGDGTVGLLVPLVAGSDRTVVPITRAGVYPVVVDLLDGGGERIATLRTYLVRLPALDPASGSVPLSVTVVVPLHAPPTDLDAAAPAPASGPVEAVATVAAALAAHPEVPVVLAATPESLAAAAATDAEAVAALAAGLGGSEVLTAPWVDVEEAAWARTDAGTLARLRARGDQSLAGLLDTSPSPSRLVAPGSSRAEIAALVDGGADAVVVDGGELEPLDTRRFAYTLARPFDLALGSAGDDDVVRAVAGDRGLAELAATAEDDPILAAHLVLADLAVIAADETDSPRVATLVLPTEAATSPAFLAALLGGLDLPAAPPAAAPPADPAQPPPAPIPAAAPLVVAATLTDALRAVEPAGRTGIAPDPGDPLVRRLADEGDVGDVTAVANRLQRMAADVASYRTIFGADDPAAARFDVVLATAAAADVDAGARTAALGSIRSAIDGRTAGLQAPARQQVRLTDREGRIQLVVTNRTGTAADVVLQLRGDRLRFPDAPDGVLPVHLDAESTRVDLRVEARSSGDAPLDIRLTSPDGRLALGESRITVRTTAFSGVGVVLMGAAAAFLAVWWTRTIVREHRSSRKRHPSHLKRA